MKTSLPEFEHFIKDKRIAVIGAGISNRPLVRWLYPKNKNITVFDKMEPSDERLIAIRNDFYSQGITLNWVTGKGYLDSLQGFDFIFRTPKMRTDLPQLIREREQGAVITSEIALFAELCPAPIYAVTGSDGKTTTTTLISLILKTHGHRVFTGGNIGTPLIDQIDNIRADDRVVLELSSFQLMDMLPLVHRAVITNIIPNHLDFHKDFDEYIDAKKNIYRAQGVLDALIVNASDPTSSRFIREAIGEVRLFNKHDSGRMTSAWRDEGALWLHHSSEHNPQRIINEYDVLLPGSFNLENILAAAAATAGDVSLDAVRKTARTFEGVAHRMELVGEVDGVRWYNSSVDSSPSRTIKTLMAFREMDESVVLIAGGQDKKSEYTDLGQAIVETTKRIVLCGQNADLILNAIQTACNRSGIGFNELEIVCAEDYEQAVRQARNLALPGDTVIFSPAGTSYDRYHHFEERGDHFRRLVGTMIDENNP